MGAKRHCGIKGVATKYRPKKCISDKINTRCTYVMHISLWGGGTDEQGVVTKEKRELKTTERGNSTVVTIILKVAGHYYVSVTKIL